MGTSSSISFNYLCKQVWHWCIERKIWLTLVQIRINRVSIDELFNSLNDSCPPPLRSMFECFDHGKDTRGNGSRLRLLKVKTEAGRKTFTFKGALTFNGLPTDLRNEYYFVNFKWKIDTARFV